MPQPARRFLAPNGRVISRPLRPLPAAPDEPEVVERVRAATSVYDEPEMPSKATVDALTDLARTYDRLRHAATVQQRQQDREALTAKLGPAAGIEARMRDADRRARLAHVDISHELYVMRRDLDHARRGAGRRPPAARAVCAGGVRGWR